LPGDPDFIRLEDGPGVEHAAAAQSAAQAKLGGGIGFGRSAGWVLSTISALTSHIDATLQ
jgi:hypothetical protein